MRRTLPALLCLLISPMVTGTPVTILKQDSIYEVADDGTWTLEFSTTRRIEEPQAVASNGQAPVQYSDTLQALEILDAYTTTKAGLRVDVAPDKIITQQLPASAGAPTFSDSKVRMVVFPQVEVGATLTLHYRIRQLKPFLPGVFSMVVSFNRFLDIDAGSVTVRAPEKLELHVSSRDVQGGEMKSTVPGRREWRWTYRDAKGRLPEPGSLIPESFSAYAAASTLESFSDLARAYMAGAAPAATVTPAVQRLADEITAGIADRRAQAEALYRWVSTQIRYVAVVIGAGGYVPHAVDAVLAARYGDCKDKTALLTSLLHAKGIRAMPVLISTAETYQLPDTVLLGAFNHAITYLPEWNLFVDATSGFAPFGVLPPALLGKQALLGGDASLPAVVKTTPVPDAKRDRVVLRTVATLSDDGSVSGSNRIEALGASEPALRGTLGSINAAQRQAAAQRLLSSSGQTGEATLTMSDARDLTVPFSFVFEFKVPQRVNLPGPGAMGTSFGMPLPSSAQSFATSMLQIQRTLDYPCPQMGAEEVLELTLPASFKFTSLPKPADIQSAYGRFTATYGVSNGRLLVSRKLDLAPPRAVCTPQDAAALRKFATEISQQMRAQLLYQ